MESIAEKRRNSAQGFLKGALEVLHRVAFLKGAKEAFLNQLAGSLEVKFVGKGEVLAHEGNEETFLVFLRRGTLRAANHHGDEEIHQDGAIIGDPLCFQTSTLWSFTIEARDFCDVQLLTTKAYATAVAIHPAEGSRIAKSFFTRRNGPSTLSSRSAGGARGSVHSADGGGDPVVKDAGLLAAMQRGSLSLPEKRATLAIGGHHQPMSSEQRLLLEPLPEVDRLAACADKAAARGKRNSMMPALSPAPRGPGADAQGSGQLLRPGVAPVRRGSYMGSGADDFGGNQLLSPVRRGSLLPGNSSAAGGGNPLLAPDRRGSLLVAPDRRGSLLPGAPSGSAADARRGSQLVPSSGRRISFQDGGALGGRGAIGVALTPPAPRSAVPPGSARRASFSLSAGLAEGPEPGAPQSARPSMAEGKQRVGSILKAAKKHADALGAAKTEMLTENVVLSNVDVYQDQHDALHVWAYAMQEDDEASRRELASWLDKIPFFTKMDAFVFERILPIIQKRAFKKGEKLLEEGTPSEALHVIYAGYADIASGSTKFATVGPEAIIGERSLANLGASFDPPMSSASVIVKTTVLVTIAVPRQPLAEMCMRDAWLLRQFDEMYSKQVADNGGCSLLSMPLFAQCDPVFALQIEVGLVKRSYGPGEVIFTEGDSLHNGMILVSGTIQVSHDKYSCSTSVASTKQCLLIGASNLTGLSGRSNCTVRTITACKVQVFAREALRKALDAYPAESITFRNLVEDNESYKSLLSTASKHKAGTRRAGLFKKQTTVDMRWNDDIARGKRESRPRLRTIATMDSEADGGAEEGFEDEDEEEDAMHQMPSFTDSRDHAFSDSSGSLSPDDHLEEEEDEPTRATPLSGPRKVTVTSEAFPSETSGTSAGTLQEDQENEIEEMEEEEERCRVLVLDVLEKERNSVLAVCRRSTIKLQIKEKKRATLAGGGGGEQDTDQEEEARREAEEKEHLMNMISGKPIMVMHDLRIVPDFSMCSQALLKKLEAFLCLRLYLPEQTVLHQGDEMSLLYILQRGHCSINVFDTDKASVVGPAIIGKLVSLLTPTVVCTVVAECTSFVATIAKNNIATVLDRFPSERKKLFASANQVFSDLCDDFHMHCGKDGLAQRLQELPLLSSASIDFLNVLAELIEAKLLLPGQLIVQDQHDVRLFFLFEGYCHVLNERETVIGTISRKMVFGEMSIFDLNQGQAVHERTLITVKTVEFCQVGTIRRPALFKALQDFPKERARFEQLVHNRLEESVHTQVSNRPCFEGMPTQLFSKVCSLLERRLLMAGEPVVTQGEPGESMIIINRGKAELVFNTIVAGMLWAGKNFGTPQMLGLERFYHATLLPKQTCHLLLLSKKSLHCLAVGTAERRWILSMRDRAQATFEAEMRVFHKKLREQKQIATSSMFLAAIAGCAELSTRFLGSVFYAWRSRTFSYGKSSTRFAHGKDKKRGQASRRSRTGAEITAMPGVAESHGGPKYASQSCGGGKYASHRSHDDDSDSSEESEAAAAKQPRKIKVAPVSYNWLARQPKRLLDVLDQPAMRVARGLRKVNLEDTGEGIVSSASWSIRAQSGRLDVWKSVDPPDWLLAVRAEIPNQCMVMKRTARGEALSTLTMPANSVTLSSLG